MRESLNTTLGYQALSLLFSTQSRTQCSQCSGISNKLGQKNSVVRVTRPTRKKFSQHFFSFKSWPWKIFNWFLAKCSCSSKSVSRHLDSLKWIKKMISIVVAKWGNYLKCFKVLRYRFLYWSVTKMCYMLMFVRYLVITCYAIKYFPWFLKKRSDRPTDRLTVVPLVEPKTFFALDRIEITYRLADTVRRNNDRVRGLAARTFMMSFTEIITLHFSYFCVHWEISDRHIQGNSKLCPPPHRDL